MFSDAFKEEVLQKLYDNTVCDEHGCWLWQGGRTTGGFGEASIGGETFYVHRLGFSLTKHALTKGKELDHLCKVRHCWNPAHLEEVLHRTNCLRGGSFSAANAQMTHCKRGHIFSEGNTYRPEEHHRVCKECKRLNDRQRRKLKGLKGNAQSRKTHCPRGHAYDMSNTYLWGGRRYCRTCQALRDKKDVVESILRRGQ